MPAPDTSNRRAVLAMPLADRLVALVGIPAFTVLVGLLLPVLARWLLDLSPGLPMRPAFRFVGAVDRPWELAINLAIWLVVGVGIGSGVVSESAKVTVTGAEVRVDRPDGARTVARADVAAAFLDGGHLVLLDRESRHLVRDTVKVPGSTVAGVFREYGYPWRDADPHADRYRRWVPGTPDLPAEANAVLAAREIALKKKARREIRDLRDVVEKFGYAVRDEGTRQYWRPLVRP
jgi:hypothetical protein